MSLRSRHKNWNWSLNRKIEVATKLRVEEKKGRSQPEAKPNEVLAKKLKLRPFINQGQQTMSRHQHEVATWNRGWKEEIGCNKEFRLRPE